MNQSLGSLPNAPLIYVLAQIMFSRVPKMESLWEDIHQRLFAEYPESEVENVTQFAIKKEGISPAQETRWHLLSRDRHNGVLLSPEMLIVHTTGYKSSNKFFGDLEVALSSLIKIIPKGIQTKRLGLRYLDLLLPRNNLDVDRQVVEKLGMLSLSEIGCSPLRFERISNYTTAIGGELAFRARQTTGTDALPSDLFPNILKPAPLLNTPKMSSTVVGSLDFDHYLNIEMELNAEGIVRKFRDLQKTTSDAFRAVTTREGMAIWEGERL